MPRSRSKSRRRKRPSRARSKRSRKSKNRRRSRSRRSQRRRSRRFTLPPNIDSPRDRPPPPDSELPPYPESDLEDDLPRASSRQSRKRIVPVFKVNRSARFSRSKRKAHPAWWIVPLSAFATVGTIDYFCRKEKGGTVLNRSCALIFENNKTREDQFNDANAIN